jgi:hypothetical protein
MFKAWSLLVTMTKALQNVEYHVRNDNEALEMSKSFITTTR